MEPAYSSGDRLLVLRTGKLKKRNVVVLRDPRTSRLILKRIERIEVERYFVSGDNPSESTDSRAFGPVAKKDILGKVILRYRRGKI